MSNLTKSEIVKYVLDCIIRTVGKRKTNLFAITTLAETTKQLETEYDFLRYIKIDTRIHSETWIAVQVDKQIDSIEEKMLGNAISKIIDKLSISVRGDKDYYIIRELRDELNYEVETALQKFGVDLNLKQLEYVVFKDEDKRIETTRTSSLEIIKSILKALIMLLNKPYPKDEAVQTLSTHIKNLEVKYDFLKYITLDYIPMAEEFYSITLSPNIDEIPPAKIGESLGVLLQEIGTSITWDNEPSFIESLKIELGADKLQKLRKIDVKLDQINVQLKRQKHRRVAQKILETLFDILTERTSKESAVTTLNTTITDLQNKYEVLSSIKIDTSKINEGTDVFQVAPEINDVESYKLGKAFKEMIKTIHGIVGDKTFVHDFKKRLGEECLQDMEKMGVNLHFLELRFA